MVIEAQPNFTMIATQYKSIPPTSPFHRSSSKLESTRISKRTRNRQLNSSNKTKLSPRSSPYKTQAPKMSTAERSSLSRSTKIQDLRPPSVIVDTHAIVEALSSEDDITPSISIQGSNGSRTSSHGSGDEPQADHIVHLSSIEQLMPRAYIRVCLAYKVPNEDQLQTAIERLRTRVRRIVDAKPYLSGYVTDVKLPNQEVGRAEIRFTTQNFLKYPTVEVKNLLNSDGSHIDYEELSRDCLPPSRLRPEDVSALPPNVNPSDLAPVFRIQANIVKGGLIVSIYLHHCISDGTGLDLITTGDVMDDDNTFHLPAPVDMPSTSQLEHELQVFAQQKSMIRQKLSNAPHDLVRTRGLIGRRLDDAERPANTPGRGCVVMISAQKISHLLDEYNQAIDADEGTRHTKNSLLMALLWRHMTRARRPSIQHNTSIKTSSLLIPVDIRQKLTEPLTPSYFGAAVDSAKLTLDLDSLTLNAGKSLCEVSLEIREAVDRVDDSYVREAIALANASNERIDVSDLQASCMDRATGADMYITSWLRLRTYQSDLGMGLGGPEWVRKPWSRDPGSCIILPQKSANPEYYEVVVQMTEMDMERLLDDQEFMKFVDRYID